MRVSQGAVTELATNMLGLDDNSEISEEEQQDAFKEMLNVICGNLLPAIAGDREEFAIGSPTVLSVEDVRIEPNNEKPLSVVRLMLENGFCDVYLFADERRVEDIVRNASVHI